MLTVIGSYSCERCNYAITHLNQKKVKYTFIDYDDLDEVEKDYYSELARKSGHSQLPIVLNEEGNVLPRYLYMRK